MRSTSGGRALGIKLLKTLLATSLLLTACSDPAPRTASSTSGSPASDTASASAGCQQFTREGLKLKARTRAALEAEVGRPTKTEVEVVANRHMPDQQDSIIRLHYDGVIVQLRKPGSGGEMFEYAAVDKRKWLNFPYFKPGVGNDNVIAAIGEPQRRDGKRLVYNCAGGEAEEPIVFETDGTTVQRIVFNYYVD
jgi:hypothetical protein